MKKSITSICVLSLFAATSAIAAGSVRIGGSGSMRAGSLKTTPMSEQSVSTTDTARMALSKSSSSLSKKLSDVVRVKETQKPTTVKPVSETDVANLESRMADLQDALEKATAQLENMKETFYTKSELDARLPQWDKENDRLSWQDPMAGLVSIKVNSFFTLENIYNAYDDVQLYKYFQYSATLPDAPSSLERIRDYARHVCNNMSGNGIFSCGLQGVSDYQGAPWNGYVFLIGVADAGYEEYKPSDVWSGAVGLNGTLGIAMIRYLQSYEYGISKDFEDAACNDRDADECFLTDFEVLDWAPDALGNPLYRANVRYVYYRK